MLVVGHADRAAVASSRLKPVVGHVGRIADYVTLRLHTAGLLRAQELPPTAIQTSSLSDLRNRLQIRLDGPYLAAFLGKRRAITLQNHQNLASPSQIFASIVQARQAASRFYHAARTTLLGSWI